MTLLERYKKLDLVQRSMFRKSMENANIKNVTWRTWMRRNNIPDPVYRKMVTRVFINIEN